MEERLKTEETQPMDPEFPYSMYVRSTHPPHHSSPPADYLHTFPHAAVTLLRSSVISLPLPSHHLASSALRALQVDTELSPLVKRTMRLTRADSQMAPNGVSAQSEDEEDNEALTVLLTEYKATTNRMLRVAVNGFMESLGVILGVMAELDQDVLCEELEQGV